MKMLLLLILLTISIPAYSPGERAIPVGLPTAINPYERIIKAVVLVESSGDNFAFNETEMSTGPFQIRPIRLQDYNQRTGNNYQLFDMFSYELSKKVFLYYCKMYGHHQTDKIIRDWNGKGRESVKYLCKVQELLLTCK